jgi:hypothetical protein
MAPQLTLRNGPSRRCERPWTARDDLFAGAGLAEDEHRDVGRRDLVDERHDLSQAALLPDDELVEGFGGHAGTQGAGVGLGHLAAAREFLDDPVVPQGDAQRLGEGAQRACVARDAGSVEERDDGPAEAAPFVLPEFDEHGLGTVESGVATGAVGPQDPDLAGNAARSARVRPAERGQRRVGLRGGGEGAGRPTAGVDDGHLHAGHPKVARQRGQDGRDDGVEIQVAGDGPPDVRCELSGQHRASGRGGGGGRLRGCGRGACRWRCRY